MLLPVEDADNELEIGWRLVRSAWGQGIASEAAGAVLAFGLEIANDRLIVADIDPDNAGSIRVAEKIGMETTGAVVVGGRSARRFTAGSKPASVAD